MKRPVRSTGTTVPKAVTRVAGSSTSPLRVTAAPLTEMASITRMFSNRGPAWMSGLVTLTAWVTSSVRAEVWS
ncbi:hypothetical protein D3C86_1900090 [compost metagenome]